MLYIVERTISFGIIIWECMTREEPYLGIPVFQVISRVMQGLRPEIPQYVISDVATLIQDCWVDNPDDRPSFSSILETLEQLHALELEKEVSSIVLTGYGGVPKSAAEKQGNVHADLLLAGFGGMQSVVGTSVATTVAPAIGPQITVTSTNSSSSRSTSSSSMRSSSWIN